MFSYTPMNKEQAEKERFELLDKGEYTAEFISAVSKISQGSKNPMIEAELNVFDESGRPYVIKDWLVFTPRMMWKVIRCMEAVDLEKEYNEQKLVPEMLVGRNCRVLVNRQEGNIIPDDKLQGKPTGSRYPEKNTIADYIKKDSAPIEPFMDEIPF